MIEKKDRKIGQLYTWMSTYKIFEYLKPYGVRGIFRQIIPSADTKILSWEDFYSIESEAAQYAIKWVFTKKGYE